jgi:hypothetical protein
MELNIIKKSYLLFTLLFLTILYTSTTSATNYTISDTWFNENFTRCLDVNISGGTENLSNFVFYFKLNYDSDMLDNFQDIRLVNSTCNNRGSLVPYEFDYVRNGTDAGIWAKSNLVTGTNRFAVYYKNPNATDGQNRSIVWQDAKLAYHFTNGTQTFNSANPNRNITIIGQLNSTFESTSFGYSLKFTLSPNYFVIQNLGNLGTGTLFYQVNTTRGQNEGGGTYSVFFDNGNSAARDLWGSTIASPQIDIFEGGGTNYIDKTVAISGGSLTYTRNITHIRTRAGVSINSNNLNFTVGKYVSAADNWIKGHYDELQFWNYTFTSARVNRSVDNSNLSLTKFNSEVSLTLPQVSINTPSNSSYNNATIFLNISSNGDSTWYNYNGTNITYTSPIYITFPQGSTTLTVYANNTYGTNSSQVTFFIDSIAPNIAINNPQNSSYNNATQLINITSDGNNIWYNYNGTNITYTSPIYITFPQGSTSLIAYSNDTIGNSNSTSVTFFIDSIAPTLSIISPNNITYNYSSILFNISSSGQNTWYNYNGTNITYSIPTYLNLSDGNYTLYVYANDTLGNYNSTSVSFTIDTFVPAQESSSSSSSSQTTVVYIPVESGFSNGLLINSSDIPPEAVVVGSEKQVLQNKFLANSLNKIYDYILYAVAFVWFVLLLLYVLVKRGKS